MAVDTILIKYEADIKKMQKQLKGIEKGMGGVEQKAKVSSKNIESAFTSSFKKIGLAIGVAFGAQQLIRAVGDAINVIKTFEKELSTLESITGSTKQEMEFFNVAAREIGLRIKTSATEVVKAFVQIGSAQPELLKNKEALAQVTEQALILSKAAGIDATSASIALTGAMNQFGASADEAAKFTDILATSQQKGSSFINETSEALINAGAAASAAGLSFEETNAAIQALAKGNIKGARAGTALRGVLSKLSSQADKEINPSLIGLEKTIENLSKRNLTLADATKLVGEEGATGLLTLIKQKDLFNDLNGSLNETGNAMNQAEINMDNLDGQLEELSVTWEDFILSIEAGEGKLAGLISLLVEGAIATIQLAKGFSEIEEFSVSFLEGVILLEQGLGKSISEFELFRIKIFGFTKEQKKLIEEQKRSNELFKKFTEGVEDSVDSIDDLTEAEKREIITLESLNKKLKEAKEELKKIEIGTNAFAEAQRNIKSIEEQIAIALGKETEAMKKLREEREKAVKAAAKAEEERLKLSIKRGEAEKKSFGDLLIFEQELAAERTKDIDIREKAELEALRLRTNQQLEVAKDNEEERNLITAKSEAERTKIQKKAAKDREDEDDKETQKKIDNLRKVVAIASEINNFLNILDQRELDEFTEKNEKKLEALIASQEAQQEQLAFELDNREITEQEAENKRLAQEEVFAAQQKALKDKQEREEREIARRSAIRNKLLGAFNIGISTAQAIITALGPPPGGLGPIFGVPASIAAGVLGAVQLAALLATPIPALAKGTKGKKGSGLAVVGEEGPELAFLGSGTKVLPASETSKHSAIIDAMYDRKLDDYINKNYVLPALKAKAGMDIESSSYDDYGLRGNVKAGTKQGKRNTDRIVRAIKDNDQQFQNYISW